MAEFTIAEDIYQPTDEEERDYWSGPGSLTVYVSQNHGDVFEFEEIEYTGCVGGAIETVGLDYLLTDMLSLKKELKEGYTYTIHNITVVWTRGDGWMSDDDVDYYYDHIERHFAPFQFLKQKISNIWWRSIGWRICK